MHKCIECLYKLDFYKIGIFICGKYQEIAYSEFGIEYKDGMCGCKHPYNWVKKRADEYAEYLGRMGERVWRKKWTEME